MNDLILNGTSLAQFGAIISAEGSWSSPARDITVVEIPGRSDPIMQDNGRWKPQKLKYRIGCVGGRTFDQVRAVLNSFAGGKVRLEDSYHPDEYRNAWFTGEVTPSLQVNNHLLEATVEFTADARRWLKSGEIAMTYTKGTEYYINNPTMFDAHPVFQISESASSAVMVVIGSGTITFPATSGSTSTLIFDTETMSCVDDKGAAYTDMTILNESSIYLAAGTTSYVRSNNSDLILTPRWYTV